MVESGQKKKTGATDKQIVFPGGPKNTSKVASYGRFDLKIGTGLKFPAKSTPLELHSSHGDPFRDQKRFQKMTLFLAAPKKLKKQQQNDKNNILYLIFDT